MFTGVLCYGVRGAFYIGLDRREDYHVWPSWFWIMCGLDLRHARYQRWKGLADGAEVRGGGGRKGIAICNKTVGYNLANAAESHLAVSWTSPEVRLPMTGGSRGISDWIKVFLFLATCAEQFRT